MAMPTPTPTREELQASIAEGLRLIAQTQVPPRSQLTPQQMMLADIERLEWELYGLIPKLQAAIRKDFANYKQRIEQDTRSRVVIDSTGASDLSDIPAVLNDIKNALNNPENHYFFAKALQELPASTPNPVQFLIEHLADPTYEGDAEPLKTYIKAIRVYDEERALIKGQQAIIDNHSRTTFEKQDAENKRNASASTIQILVRECQMTVDTADIESEVLQTRGGAKRVWIQRRDDFTFQVLNKDSDEFKKLNTRSSSSEINRQANTEVTIEKGFPSYALQARVLSTEAVVSTKAYDKPGEPSRLVVLVHDLETGHVSNKTNSDDWCALTKEAKVDVALMMAKQYLLNNTGSIKITGHDQEQVDCLHAAVLYLMMQDPKAYERVDVHSVCNGSTVTRMASLAEKKQFVEAHLGFRYPSLLMRFAESIGVHSPKRSIGQVNAAEHAQEMRGIRASSDAQANKRQQGEEPSPVHIVTQQPPKK
jgi:hypothetical protein